MTTTRTTTHTTFFIKGTDEVWRCESPGEWYAPSAKWSTLTRTGWRPMIGSRARDGKPNLETVLTDTVEVDETAARAFARRHRLAW